MSRQHRCDARLTLARAVVRQAGALALASFRDAALSVIDPLDGAV